MRIMEFRGGANEYKINEVLGPKFKEFITMLDNQKLKAFTFETLAKQTTTQIGPNTPKLNDIHYDFTEYLVAASAAFRQIETPEYKKAELAGKFADVVSDIFKKMTSEHVTGEIFTIPTELFSFPQLPCKSGAKKITHLVNGFHLFPYTSATYEKPYPSIPENGLINAIKYLYHYIALLDLTNLDAKEVINFLREDNYTFMKYVYQIVDAFMSTDYFTKSAAFATTDDVTTIILDGVLGGLTTIALRIINNFNEINKSLPATAIGIGKQFENFQGLDNTNAKDFKAYLKSLIPGFSDDAVLTEVHALFADDYKDVLKTGATMPTGLSPERIREYQIDGLNNPFYLNIDAKKTVFSEMIDPTKICTTQKQYGGTNKGRSDRNNKKHYDNQFYHTGGVISGTSVPTSADGKIASLCFLYGPKKTTGTNPDKQFLITANEHGDKDATATILNANTAEFMYESIDKITQFSDNPSTNPVKIILLAALIYLVENKINAKVALTDDQKTAIVGQMRNSVTKYRIVSHRLKNIPKTNFAASLEEFRDAFISEFTLGAYKQGQGLVWDVKTAQLVKSTAAQPTNIPKSNLEVAEIKDFYTNIVASDPDFYQKFFNLVRSEKTSDGKEPNTDAPIKDAMDVINKPDDLRKYRLNVRKLVGWTRLTGGQFGGKTYGEIMLNYYVPLYLDDPNIGDLWISRSIKIPKNQLLSENGSEALRYIVRKVYNTPVTENTIEIYGVPISLIDIVNKVTQTAFAFDYQLIFKNALKAAVSTAPGLPALWKEGEIKLTEHMLRVASKWEREDDHFVLKNDKGEIVDQEINNCALINENTRDCMGFFTSCFSATDANFDTACSRILDFNFNISASPEVLKKEVMKIDPSVAFAILKQFKFGSRLEEEKYRPFKGFKRYKVQSVSNWLEELFSDKDRCNVPPVVSPNPCGTLRQQLGALADVIMTMARSNNKAFLDYLDILVQWVNANPQVLNPEEAKYMTVTERRWPDIDKSFRLYDHVNPYVPAEIRLRGIVCGLERLKGSIVNEIAGFRGSGIISNIAKMPLGIDMPFGRPGFVSPVPQQNFLPMFGGFTGIYETESDLQNLNAYYGYTMFNQLYQDLISTMDSLVGKKIRISGDSKSGIELKLENFRKLEEEIRHAISSMIEKKKLQQASRGYIDPEKIKTDDELAAVFAKHSNLLRMSAAYNKKATNLIDYFRTITEAILGKITETGKQTTFGYERPLTMGYHIKKN